MVKIASNQAAAQAAVSSIKKVNVKQSESVSLGKSNINSMKQGIEVNNRLLSDLDKLVRSVNKQADKFPQLAGVIASRDSQTRFG